MDARQVLATHDYRELMQSLGVTRSATDFCCPKCQARSFMVLRARPMEVECLQCGTVAPFSIRAAHDAEVDAGPFRAVGPFPPAAEPAIAFPSLRMRSHEGTQLQASRTSSVVG